MKCCKDFCNETSIHGFNHIAAPRRHWLERLLWLCACGLAIWMALNVSIGQLQRYNESPTVVTLEKDFRSWQFSMPAITCCYEDRMDRAKLPGVIKEYWNIEANDEKYDYYTRFVKAVANSDILNLQMFEQFQDMQMSVDMYQIAVDVMPEVNIKTVPSEAGDWKWWPVMTEAGVCYVTNSLALADVAIVLVLIFQFGKPNQSETASSPVMCKNSANNCYIVVDNYAVAKYYVHSPYDVMDATSVPSVAYLSLTRESELSTMESRCGRGVRELHPRRRGGPICTPAGMWCLSFFAQNITSNNGERCTCAPQCVDSVFKEINKKDQNWDKPPFSSRSSIKFVVQGPRTRYTREIVFHFQDLVVSFGGAAGLFLGASFISFIEILYFFLSRLFYTIFKKNEKNQKTTAVKSKLHTTAHETFRVEHLNAVLDSQKKYQYDLM
ncbi:unnamed protein product [Arctia plantaginis]|uniref:Uncharacterized protein n=1 Tax=Arctia plantaginis TaxID=874455 RepID=A0A8S0YT18_ARCPL|nr:unnamed protein product [Arctia plantaginis]